jgi:hypothetical protein
MINFSALTGKEAFLVTFTLQTFTQSLIIYTPDRKFVKRDVNHSIYQEY